MGKEDKEEKDMRDEVTAEIFGGVEPEPTPEPEVEPEIKPEVKEDEKEEPKEDDPWAGVSPALRERYEKLESRLSHVDTLEQRLKTAEGRVGALQSELAKKPAVKPAPPQEEIDAAETDEEWEELKEDYPEWAEAVEKKFAKMEEKLGGSTDIKSLLAEEREKINSEVERRIVKLRHPGYTQTIQTPEFWTWMKAQTQELKEKVASEKAEDAISILDAYKEARKQVDKKVTRIQERKERLEASVTPKTAAQKPIKTEEDLTEEELRAKVASEIWET